MGLFNNYSNCNCDNYSCDCSQFNGPDKIGSSCCLDSIRQTLLQIINAIKKITDMSFNINIEITTKNGVVNTINLSTLNINNVVLTETTLVVGDLAISLCDIVKINILSSTVTDPTFVTMLLNAIRNITTNGSSSSDDCSNGNCDSCSCQDRKCAQEIQNYINRNINSIESIGYNGSVAQIQTISAISDITTVDVVGSASIATTTSPSIATATLDTDTTSVLSNPTLDTDTTSVLSSPTLDTDTTSVIETITPAATDIVSDVVLNNTSLLSGVTPTTVEVSGPITPTPTSVVSAVTTAEESVVTEVATETETVVTGVTPTSNTVVTGFGASTTTTGVISNVTNIQNITPTSVDVPAFTSTGTGTLQITIPTGAIDGTNPTSPVNINVTVGGQTISFDGNTARFVLPSATNVLGGSTESPQTTDITVPGTPTTGTFVQSIETTTADVISSVTPTTDTINSVDTVTNIDINNITTPETVTVVQSIEETSETVNTVTSVETTPASDLFTTTTADVLSSATLTGSTTDVLSSATLTGSTTDVLSSATLATTTQNLVNSVTLTTTEESVINDLNASSQTVYTPAEEDIDGQVFAAGDGIMVVNNTNGDISIYSICDINTVTS